MVRSARFAPDGQTIVYIGSQIGVNALSDFAIQPLGFGRGLKCAGLVASCLAGGGFCGIGLSARPRGGLLGPIVRGLFPGQTFGDLPLEVVKLRVFLADQVKVTPFEGAQFRAQICGMQFAFRQFAFQCAKFFALAAELLLFRFYAGREGILGFSCLCGVDWRGFCKLFRHRECLETSLLSPSRRSRKHAVPGSSLNCMPRSGSNVFLGKMCFQKGKSPAIVNAILAPGLEMD